MAKAIKAVFAWLPVKLGWYGLHGWAWLEKVYPYEYGGYIFYYSDPKDFPKDIRYGRSL